MLVLQDILKNYEKPKTKITSQRTELVREFFEELTLDRKFENMRRYRGVNRLRGASGQKPLTPDEFKKHDLYLEPFKPSYIGFRLSHVKDLSDLYYFLSVCRDYKNRNGSFAKMFFGALKIK